MRLSGRFFAPGSEPGTCHPFVTKRLTRSEKSCAARSRPTPSAAPATSCAAAACCRCPPPPPRAPRAWAALRARLSDADLAWLTRQLASLLAARLPLDAALSATLDQAEKKHIATVLLGVRDDVRAGHKLSAALAARPRDFPRSIAR